MSVGAGIIPPSKKSAEALSLQKIAYKEVELTPDLPATRLVQSIRDESHRFAKRLHTIKRDKALLGLGE